MSKTIVLELEDADYERLLQEAQAEGRKIEEVAARRLCAADAAVAPPSALPAVLPSPTLNGPNSDWTDILQQFARSQAEGQGGTPEEHLARLEGSLTPTSAAANASGAELPVADPVERHFGAINSGDPNSADNDRIDADLARYYLRELDGNEDAA